MAHITIITSIGQGRDTHMIVTATSLYHAARQAPHHTVAWNLANQQGTHNDPDLPERLRAELVGTIDVHPLPLDSVCPACVGRNHAAANAQPGTVLVNLDSDDLMAPGRLTLINDQTTVQVTDTRDYVCRDGSWQVDTAKTIEATSNFRPGTRPAPWFKDSFAAHGRLDFMCSTLAVRRDILLSVGGYPALPWCEDTVLAQRISDAGYDLEVRPEVGMLYRQHPAQTTRKNYDATRDVFDHWLRPLY